VVVTDSAAPTQTRRAEVDRRLRELRALLVHRGATAAILRTRRNFAWLTAGGLNHIVLSSELGVAAIHVIPNDLWVETAINEAARIRDEELDGLGIEVRSVPWQEPLGSGTDSLPTDGTLTDADLETDLALVRSRLSDFDQKRIEALGRATISALEASLDELHLGESEEKVAASAVAKLGAEATRAPVVLAAADGRIDRYRHPLPTATTVKRRLMLVLVAERWGLHVAATRIREFEEPSPELRRRIAAVRDVERAMHEATVPGRTLGDVYEAARAAYASVGFPNELDLHHQGGIIGYQGRERIALPDDETSIEPGMAFAWNPSITGAKAEDTFILDPDGTRKIVTASRRNL
jgi:Xaa-Pro aminopeptidase